MRTPLLGQIAAISATAILATATTGKDAHAAPCQKGYERVLRQAVDAGDKGLVEVLKSLPEIPVYDLSNNAICNIRVYADLADDEYSIFIADAQKYANTDGTYINCYRGDGKPGGACAPRKILLVNNANDRTQLQNNANVIAAYKKPVEAQNIISSINTKTFVGLKIGLNLEQTFATLSRQGYIGPKLPASQYPYTYGKAYRFGIDCSAGNYKTASSNGEAHEYKVRICNVTPSLNGMKFERIDASGTKYTVSVWFTGVDRLDREELLSHAALYRIKGSIQLKGDLGLDYYADLARSKYGNELNIVIPSDYPIGHKYGVYSAYGKTIFRADPTADELKVEIESADTADEINDKLVDRLISNESHRAASTPRPDF